MRSAAPSRFEGVLGAPVPGGENHNGNARAFLPYNPTVLEIGAYEGAGTVGLAQDYPYGRVFACEPNPRAFAVLSQRVRSFGHVFPVETAFGPSGNLGTLYLGSPAGRDASLLPPARDAAELLRGPELQVGTATLDDWLDQRGIDRVEFIRVDAGGLELQILQHGRRALERTLVIVTRTYFGAPRPGVMSYGVLKLFLELVGFELLSHWYEEGQGGEATFIRRALYDSVFR